MAHEKHALEVLHNHRLNQYLDHVGRYRGALPGDARAIRDFPSFELWCGCAVPLEARRCARDW